MVERSPNGGGGGSDMGGPAVATPPQMLTMAEMERRIASGVVPWTPPDLRPTIRQLTSIYNRPPMVVEVHESLPPLTINIQRIEEIGDSCGFRSVIALCGGYVLGGMFGLFFSGLETPGGVGYVPPAPATPAAGGAKGVLGMPATPGQLAVQEQTVKGAMREVAKSMHRTGRNFAMIGCMFAGTECVVESLRGRTDHGASVYNNSVIAGFLVGGALGFRAGPQAALIGGAGFAVFSVAIDHFMKG